MARVTATATGAIASYKSPGHVPVRHLKVNFLPKQEGTGDPSPVNVRNIIGRNGVTGYTGGINYSSAIVAKSNMQNSNGVFTNTNVDAKNYFQAVVQLFNGSTYIKNAADKTINQAGMDSLSVTIDVSNVTAIIFKHSGSQRDLSLSFPFDGEQGTYTISFNVLSANPSVVGGLQISTIAMTKGEPQSLPVTFPAVGKNLLKYPYVDSSISNNGITGTANSDGTVSLSGQATANTFFNLTDNQTLGAGTYTISKSNVSGVRICVAYQTSGTLIAFGETSAAAFTLDSEAVVKTYVRVASGTNISSGITVSPMLETGSSASAYEKYTNTVYGGSFDVTTGVLTVEWEFASAKWGDIKGSTPNQTTGYYQGIVTFKNKIMASHYQTDYGVKSVCNMLSTVIWDGIGRTPEHFYSGNNDTTGNAYVFGNFDDDLVLQFAVKLATPITYQLTPTELQSFIGQNNVWSDADSVEVTYDYAEPMDFVKKRMGVAAHCNMVHEYTTTGNPATFKTDVARNLKSLEIPFTPYQEGSGDPSTTNVRSIVGLSGVTAQTEGTNLLNDTTKDLYYGMVYVGGKATDYPVLLSPGTYRVTVLLTEGKVVDGYYKSVSGSSTKYFTNGTTGTFTISSEDYYSIYFYNSSVGKDDILGVSLTKGEDIVPYTPYSGQSIPVQFPATGKNLFDKTKITSGKYINPMGTITSGSSGQCVTGFIPVKPGESIMISHNRNSSFNSCFYSQPQFSAAYVVPYSSTSKIFANSLYPITVPSGANYLAITYNPNNTDAFQVERGTSSTSYEPYSNIVYGGVIDPVKGTMLVTHECIELPSNYTWSDMSSYYVLWHDHTNIPQSASSISDTLTSHFKNTTGISASLFVNDAGHVLFGSLLLSAIGVSSSEELNSWIAAQKANGTPVQICYELAEPYTISVDPVQIQQTIGDNTIRTDTNGINTIIYSKRG